MDADGLPLIGPSVDYQEVEPINQKKTVEYLNHFIVHTAGFLNRFSTVCEEKLASLSTRIERLHTQMSLLEGKINSVPGLENVTAATTTAANDATSQAPAATPAAPAPSAAPADIGAPDVTPPQDTKQPEAPQAVSGKSVAQDPRYARFFKMLTVGIPPMAVKQKMAMEGLNPDLLDNPTAAIPDSQPAIATDDSDEDFSNDEQNSSDESITFSD